MIIGPTFDNLIDVIVECPDCKTPVEVEYMPSLVCGPNGSYKKIRKTTCPKCRSRTFVHLEVATLGGPA